MRVCPLVLLLALPACGEEPSEVDPLTCGETFKDIPIAINRQLDLLFVIDNAPSMAGEQDSLAVNTARFANVLESIEGGLPDLHLAVTTSDLAIDGLADCTGDGSFHTPVDCGVDGDFLVNRDYLDDTSDTNFTGSFVDTFSCVADVGVGGCPIRQPVAAALRALEHPGFLRDEAHLGVLFISDGDDCSADPAFFDPDDPELEFRCFEHGVVCDPDEPSTPGAKQDCQPRAISQVDPIADQVAALRALKPDPGMLSVGVVAGPASPVVVEDLALAPSCTSATAEAGPAIRLSALAESFPNRSTVTSMCNADLSDLLVIYANLLVTTLGVPCLEGDIDREPDTAGLQVECVVSDVRYPGTDQQEETLIPACADTDELPCWRLEEDRIYCPDTTSGAVLQVDRHDYPASGTHTQVRCRTLC